MSSDVSTGQDARSASPHVDGDLAQQLSELARTLLDEPDVGRTLEAVVHAAVATIPGADYASISAIERRREVRTQASSADLPREVDRAQYETQQGPCLDTLYEQETVRLDDLESEERWPDFIARARRLGVGSMLAVQLFVEGDDLGALNLTSSDPGAFDAESENAALLFAAHAAVAMSSAQQQERLRKAVDTRDLIGQGKGILIERFRITGDQAFELLVRASQHTNRKLHDIAEELVSTGQLPRG